MRLPTNGEAQVRESEALRQLTLAGLGLSRLASFEVRADIATGRLVPVLEVCNPGDRADFHAVFLSQGGLLPARVRVFLDSLIEKVRIG
jgi:DNA-binding transcriptional LysR family regulator